MTRSGAPWDGLLAQPEVVHTQTRAARSPSVVAFPDELPTEVIAALTRSGIQGLYQHQLTTWRHARDGRHVVVTAGTASGKSLAFNLAVLERLQREPRARALYLYPTKALAQDQARSIAGLKLDPVRSALYDGDTDSRQRRDARRGANVLLTNPDMLNVGILPHHTQWQELFGGLDFVIVDESHVYRGVFGSHVANVLRRLRRIAALHASSPTFVLASATIANPEDHAAALLGVEAELVEARGPDELRTTALWNPEVLDESLGARGSPLDDAARLLAELVGHGLRTIVFVKTRRAAEVVHRLAVDRVAPELADRLTPYRAGYTSEQRRQIERRLTSGDLLGITTTSALELGIDVGLLDCSVCAGFPGTVASLRQRWGRAGRQRQGLAILVASNDALDQFFIAEPAALLERDVEAVIIDHANPRILDRHVRAAAFEAPLTTADAATLGAPSLERAEAMADAGQLRRGADGFRIAGDDYPAAAISLRSGEPGQVTIVHADEGAILGTVDRARAPRTVHEGAIYLHLGDSYRVVACDKSVALVEPFAGDYYTQTKESTTTTIEGEPVASERLGVPVRFGRVVVTEQVTGYQRRSTRDGTPLSLHPLSLAPQTFETEAVWFMPPPVLLPPESSSNRYLGALHAAEHGLIAMLPLWAMCDRWDIGGLSTDRHPQTETATIFVYDGHAGGVGIARRAYDAFEGWVADTRRLLAACRCDAGCPSCVQSPKCGNLNEPLDKCGALELLAQLAEAAPDDLSRATAPARRPRAASLPV